MSTDIEGASLGRSHFASWYQRDKDRLHDSAKRNQSSNPSDDPTIANMITMGVKIIAIIILSVLLSFTASLFIERDANSFAPLAYDR